MPTMKQLRRKKQREIFKMVESQLHPTLNIGNVEIAHRHTAHWIEFTAWIGETQKSQYALRFSRESVLAYPNFYNARKADFEWLANQS